MKQKKIWTPKTVGIGLVALVLLFVPAITDNNYVITTLVYCFVFASLGVAWNMIGGYGAQVSWCHAVFVALGAYSSMILFKRFGVSPFLSIFVGMALALLLATIIGYGTFRLRGPYFSLSTIAFAEIIRIIIQYWGDLTGGASGYSVQYKGANFFNLMFENDVPFYYIMFALMAVVLGVTAWFEKSKIGYYLGAIKGDEDAAISLGINSIQVKLRAFQISAVIAAAVGTFYGFFLTFIDPMTICSLDFSVKIGIGAIVGGLGTLWGPVLGAFVVNILTQLLNSWFSNIGGLSQCLYGLALVVIVIFRPAGLISLFPGWKGGSGRKKGAKEVVKK